MTLSSQAPTPTSKRGSKQIRANAFGLSRKLCHFISPSGSQRCATYDGTMSDDETFSRRIRRFLHLTIEDDYVPTDGTLLEGPIPKDRRPRWFKYPNLPRIQRKRKSQSESALFRLPFEIRNLIYLEVWREAGLSQHIVVHHGGYTHTQCVINHDGLDERQTEIRRIVDGSTNPSLRPHDKAFHDVWSRRLGSKWCNHWKCEERAASRGALPKAISAHSSPCSLCVG